MAMYLVISLGNTAALVDAAVNEKIAAEDRLN